MVLFMLQQLGGWGAWGGEGAAEGPVGACLWAAAANARSLREARARSWPRPHDTHEPLPTGLRTAATPDTLLRAARFVERCADAAAEAAAGGAARGAEPGPGGGSGDGPSPSGSGSGGGDGGGGGGGSEGVDGDLALARGMVRRGRGPELAPSHARLALWPQLRAGRGAGQKGVACVALRLLLARLPLRRCWHTWIRRRAASPPPPRRRRPSHSRMRPPHSPAARPRRLRRLQRLERREVAAAAWLVASRRGSSRVPRSCLRPRGPPAPPRLPPRLLRWSGGLQGVEGGGRAGGLEVGAGRRRGAVKGHSGRRGRRRGAALDAAWEGAGCGCGAGAGRCV
jgi:hypothetical protein